MSLSLWSKEIFNNLLAASAVFSDTLLGGAKSYKARKIGPELSVKALKQEVDAIEQNFADGNYAEAARRLIDGAVLYGHPGYINQQLCFPTVASTFGQFWAGILNQGHAVFSMSPLNSVIEARVLDWGKSCLRLEPSAFGLTTGGGSLGTLTAMSAARNRLSEWAGWHSGDHSGIRVLTSSYSHYSIARSAAIIGVGRGQVIEVGNDDEDGGVDIDALAASTLSEVGKGNACIVCLSLGNTVAGGVDRIDEYLEKISAVRDRVWVHVDAAHGGSFYHLPKFNHIFGSLKYCDSVIWNPHKLMFQTIPLCFLYFKSKTLASYVAMHDSPYLSQDSNEGYSDMHPYTLECSRSSSALKMWMTLNIHGEADIVAAHGKLLDLTEKSYRLLRSQPNVKFLCRPTTNIVCFRFTSGPTERSEDDGSNLDIVNKINDGKKFSIGQVKAKGRTYIRLCFMNPETEWEDVQGLIFNLAEEFDSICAAQVA